MSKKILITGIGRSGTTFIYRVLTEAGAQGGREQGYRSDINSGHDYHRHAPEKSGPVVQKHPEFLRSFPAMEDTSWVGAIIVCRRDYDQAQLSRNVNGIPWMTREGEYREALKKVANKALADGVLLLHLDYEGFGTEDGKAFTCNKLVLATVHCGLPEKVSRGIRGAYERIFDPEKQHHYHGKDKSLLRQRDPGHGDEAV